MYIDKEGAPTPKHNARENHHTRGEEKWNPAHSTPAHSTHHWQGIHSSDLSKMVKDLMSLINESENLGDYMQLLTSGIRRMKSTVAELEIVANRISSHGEMNRAQLSATLERMLDYIGTCNFDAGDFTLPKQVPPRQCPVQHHPTPGKKKTALPPRESGIMIFICPEAEKRKNARGDTTCVPRRQLVPSTEEEKLLLNYLIRTNNKPSQKEYNRLYKEICYMLLNAPKNAIAIEIRAGRTSDSAHGKSCIELFYHVQVKDSVTYASFKYIEILGIEAIRAKSGLSTNDSTLVEDHLDYM